MFYNPSALMFTIRRRWNILYTTSSSRHTTTNSRTCYTAYTMTLRSPSSSFISTYSAYPAHTSTNSLSSALVKCFTTPELMRWPGIESIYGPHLRKTSVFSSDKLWEDLHTRVIEHVSDFLS